MRLAFSNLAWDAERDDDAAVILTDHGFTGVELAPTKLWPRPLEASEADAVACRRAWERRGLAVVALQALLFGRPDLAVFGDTRAATLEYLAGICRLAGWLGATALVFGSPKNRLASGVPGAWASAVEFFRRAGEAAAARGVCLCIEHNPPEYGCDFVTTADDAARLVADVAHPGFGLHLDLGGLALTREPLATVTRLAPLTRHFHASEPHLAPLGEGETDLRGTLAALRAGGYGGWVSVEMRRADAEPMSAVASAAQRVRECAA